ncbi:hypothetical protein GCM10027184_69600 [Saccharothrix stipae]
MTGKRLRVNVMSAVASRGALWSTVFTERFTAAVFTAFLDRVARQADRKVHVIADRHPVHRSKAVRAWLQDNTDRVELHLMPGYSPNSTRTSCSTPTSNATNASRARNVDPRRRCRNLGSTARWSWPHALAIAPETAAASRSVHRPWGIARGVRGGALGRSWACGQGIGWRTRPIRAVAMVSAVTQPS